MEPETNTTAPTTENSNNGSEPQTTNIIDKADAISKGLDERIKTFEALVKRQEDAVARMMLSGKSNAGSVIKSQAETEAEAIDKKAKELLSKFGR